MQTRVLRITIACAAALAFALPLRTQASITFDDFNVNEGHFNQEPTFSGSTAGLITLSSATRVTANGPLEGAGHEQLIFITNGVSLTPRVRFLSGGGSQANNTAFATTAGTDGWIGCFVKTTNAGWTVQIWLEGPAGSGINNGSNQKTIVADNQWHLYEWNLDDNSGGVDGWGDVQNILSGSPTMMDTNHTIDSIIFRHTAVEVATNVLFLDYVAKSDSGTVSNLLLDPCLATSAVAVNGPLSTNSNQVLVTGVAASATNLTVYQNTGGGGSFVAIGSKTSGVVAGDNLVTVSGMVKGKQVAATQKINGQQGCIPTLGVFAGGGANPSVKIAVSIRETISTGPVGSAGDSTSANLHFLGATTVSGGAPINAGVVYPSNEWQTITFLRGTNEVIGDPATASGTIVSAAGYTTNDNVAIQAYAYRALANGVTIYSLTPAQTSDLTSNDVFAVNWSWDAVAGAQGYRLLRNINGSGFVDYVDVAVNSYNDSGTGWTSGSEVTPTTSQAGKSVQWNPSTSNTNNLPGQWGILESINFCIDNLDDSGPFNLFIDNLQNGTTVFQDFESVIAGTTDFGFRQPSFSGTTSGSILTLPNVGAVSDLAKDTGVNSFNVQYQWNGTNATKWLRLTTSGLGNPQMNLDDPISFRLLLLPVGSTAGLQGPVLSANLLGSATVLSWSGAHQLQASTSVLGTYTNVPGVTFGPWTNNLAEPQKFFRLFN